MIMRNMNFMCMTLERLTFLDIINYWAPGYLKAYVCTQTTHFSPYEWMTSLHKFDCETLHSKDAFHSELKNEDITDENDAYCQTVLRDHDMKTFRDFPVWYTNRDVVPFLEGLQIQFYFYQNCNIDMFKDGLSVPGSLTLKFMFNVLPPDIHFYLFNDQNKNLHDTLKNGLTGGPSIVFHRHQEAGVTNIRQFDHRKAARSCEAIVGYDANVLYLWSIMQDMLTETLI